ncbi:hypothetical protein DFJ77DRAFT_476062, partial [Powellomyces hirtus]
MSAPARLCCSCPSPPWPRCLCRERGGGPFAFTDVRLAAPPSRAVALAASLASSGAGAGLIPPVSEGTLRHHRWAIPVPISGAHILKKLKLPMTNEVCKGGKFSKHKVTLTGRRSSLLWMASASSPMVGDLSNTPFRCPRTCWQCRYNAVVTAKTPEEASSAESCKRVTKSHAPCRLTPKACKRKTDTPCHT